MQWKREFIDISWGLLIKDVRIMPRSTWQQDVVRTWQVTTRQIRSQQTNNDGPWYKRLHSSHNGPLQALMISQWIAAEEAVYHGACFHSNRMEYLLWNNMWALLTINYSLSVFTIHAKNIIVWVCCILMTILLICADFHVA